MIKDPQLLATKVLLPQSAAGLIDRPRLLELVTLIQSKRLTVIKAAAGFGKTSLAVAWAQWLQQNGHSVAWVALDPDDDEPRRFLLYVAHALGRACAGLGKVAIGLTSDISLVPPRTVVATLINELVDSGDEIYLFLPLDRPSGNS
jgi:LuxR family transcriptional regulator, maltose regulon positive regulatory protein